MRNSRHVWLDSVYVLLILKKQNMNKIGRGTLETHGTIVCVFCLSGFV